MMGQGDCDDSAVLLASLFLRAGISGTELCEVDSDSDGKYDHLTVGVKQSNGLHAIYESTWPPSDYLYYKKGDPVPTEPAPVDEWSYPAKILYCYSPEETVSYALAKKCNDGTEYGKCSVEKPMFCDEKLGLVNDCERCGCDSKYPHCAKVGENKGTCRVCPESTDVWIDEYAVCCPRGYEEYHPEDSSCWER